MLIVLVLWCSISLILIHFPSADFFYLPDAINNRYLLAWMEELTRFRIFAEWIKFTFLLSLCLQLVFQSFFVVAFLLGAFFVLSLISLLFLSWRFPFLLTVVHFNFLFRLALLESIENLLIFILDRLGSLFARGLFCLNCRNNCRLFRFHCDR